MIFLDTDEHGFARIKAILCQLPLKIEQEYDKKKGSEQTDTDKGVATTQADVFKLGDSV